MDLALFIVTAAIVCLVLAVTVFLSILVAHRMGQVSRQRRLARAERRYTPLVEKILSGEATPDSYQRFVPGTVSWVVVEDMLRRELRRATPERAGNIERFIDQAGFTHHYIRQMEQGDHWERAISADRLAGHGGPEAIERLIAAIGDPAREVRTVAVRALGRSGDEAALTALADMLVRVAIGEVTLSQRVVTGALTRFGGRAAGVLTPLLGHDSWRVRGAAIYILGEVQAFDRIPAIMGCLADAETDVRAKAAQALGRMGAHSALFPLLARLEDAAWLVRMHAVRALGRLGDATVVAALSRRLFDAHWRVRQEAAVALAHMGTIAVEALTHTLVHTEDRYAREQVLEELQRTTVIPDAIERLATESGDITVPGSAAALLFAAVSAGSVSLLLGAMDHHPRPVVRLAVMRLLATVDHPRIVPALVKAQHDHDPAVSREAAEQLQRRQPESVVA